MEEKIVKRNIKIIGGFICPSSDSYVQSKLQKDAIKLQHRNSMCKLATKDSDFIVECPFGYGSAKKSGSEIEQILNTKIRLNKKIFGSHKIKFLEIGGADCNIKSNLF